MAPSASADQLSSLKAEAQSVANQIQALGIKEEALSEQYDGAHVSLQTDEQKVAAAGVAVAAANAATAKAKATLKTEAVNAYIHSGTAGAADTSSPLGNANSSLLRAEYVSSLATDQSDAQDRYHLASLQAQTAKVSLQTAQSQAQKQVDALAADRTQVVASQSKLQGVEDQETSQIATLVAQIQAAQEAAAQAAATAAANARAAAAAAAAAQAAAAAHAQEVAVASLTPVTAAPAAATAPAAASPEAIPAATPDPTTTTPAAATGAPAAAVPVTATPTTVAPTVTAAPVAASSGIGAAAMAAAATRIGDPYVWGAAGPSSFDCSGLVQWAFAQVGVSLPHYSGSQFSDGVEIPMSQLEPGDLVFFANTGEHVAFYAGNGEVLQAPETGEDVGYAPMYSEFVLAVRIS